MKDCVCVVLVDCMETRARQRLCLRKLSWDGYWNVRKGKRDQGHRSNVSLAEEAPKAKLRYYNTHSVFTVGIDMQMEGCDCAGSSKDRDDLE